jgi:hypothetical protein
VFFVLFPSVRLTLTLALGQVDDDFLGAIEWGPVALLASDRVNAFHRLDVPVRGLGGVLSNKKCTGSVRLAVTVRVDPGAKWFPGKAGELVKFGDTTARASLEGFDKYPFELPAENIFRACSSSPTYCVAGILRGWIERWIGAIQGLWNDTYVSLLNHQLEGLAWGAFLKEMCSLEEDYSGSTNEFYEDICVAANDFLLWDFEGTTSEAFGAMVNNLEDWQTVLLDGVVNALESKS